MKAKDFWKDANHGKQSIPSFGTAVDAASAGKPRLSDSQAQDTAKVIENQPTKYIVKPEFVTPVPSLNTGKPWGEK